MSKEIQTENTENRNPSKEKEKPITAINPQKKEATQPFTYTPLNQDAKPYISKRMKNINNQKPNELINKAIFAYIEL